MIFYIALAFVLVVSTAILVPQQVALWREWRAQSARERRIRTLKALSQGRRPK